MLTNSLVCVGQLGVEAEKMKVKGIVIYPFLKEDRISSYYYSMNKRIIIDSTAYDFIPHVGVNSNIIRKYDELVRHLGDAKTYNVNDFIVDYVMFNPNAPEIEGLNVDSIKDVYRRYNIYDSLLFYEDYMVWNIRSEAIFSKENNDTLHIAFEFYGTVIKYDNIIYGAQTDYRILKFPDGTECFDDSHSWQPFEKYDTTIVVLNEVDSIRSLDEATLKYLNFHKSEVKKIGVFRYM